MGLSAAYAFIALTLKVRNAARFPLRHHVGRDRIVIVGATGNRLSRLRVPQVDRGSRIAGAQKNGRKEKQYDFHLISILGW